MSEFKIAYETTLYELQEHCRNNDCDTCCLNERECSCRFIEHSPDAWNIKKPKTYKDDLLEKYPNVFISDKGTPAICRDLLYYGETAHCLRNDKLCAECWNETMEIDTDGNNN